MATTQQTTDQFIHGIQFIGVDTGGRTVQTRRMNTIWMIGTAPKADNDVFKKGKNTLIPGIESMIASLGDEGTLPIAARQLFKVHKKYAPFVVVYIAKEGENEEETLANIVGGVNSDSGDFEGIKRALIAEQDTKVKPRVLIAPYFSQNKPVADALNQVSNQLRGVCYIDAPNGETDKYEDAIEYRNQFGDRRINPIYPWPVVYDTVEQGYIEIPGSILAAGAEGMTNYYDSSSMTILDPIQGLTKPVTFEEGNPNTITNLLNEHGVTTFIQQKGWRLYGLQGASDDPVWKYRPHVRTDDAIAEAIIHAHTWAKDRQIKRTYTDEVLRSLNTYLQYLGSPAVEAIAGGVAWLDPEVNDVDRIVDNGEIYFDFDYGRFGYAEKLKFRRHLNNGYVKEVLFS